MMCLLFISKIKLFIRHQTGVVERKHIHILDVVRTMMIYISVPKYLWYDAVLSVCHHINMMPSSVLDGKISFSCLYPYNSVFSMTPCAFSCTCFVQNLSLGLDKLSPQSIKCVFVGYFRTQKGYLCYNSSTRKYFVSADVTFFKSVPYFSPQHHVTASETISLPLFVSFSACAFADSSPVTGRHFGATCFKTSS